MKLVLVNHVSDGITYSENHYYPFEYSSKEDAVYDLNETRLKSLEVNHQFTFQGEYLDNRYPIEVFTLDEWFEINKLGKSYG